MVFVGEAKQCRKEEGRRGGGRARGLRGQRSGGGACPKLEESPDRWGPPVGGRERELGWAGVGGKEAGALWAETC